MSSIYGSRLSWPSFLSADSFLHSYPPSSFTYIIIPVFFFYSLLLPFLFCDRLSSSVLLSLYLSTSPSLPPFLISFLLLVSLLSCFLNAVPSFLFFSIPNFTLSSFVISSFLFIFCSSSYYLRSSYFYFLIPPSLCYLHLHYHLHLPLSVVFASPSFYRTLSFLINVFCFILSACFFPI